MTKKRKECLCSLSAKSLAALGAVANFETVCAIFGELEPETVVQLEKSPTGHLWMELFEHICVSSHDSMSLFGQTNRGASDGSVGPKRTSAW